MIGRGERVYKDIADWLSGATRVVVAGIGNPIRSDDFVGVKIVQGLKGKVSENTLLIECETVPESFIQQILEFKPSHVLLIDSAIMGLKPGESRLVDPAQLADSPAFSTHILPLRIFCEYILRAGSAKIELLLIEPMKTDFEEGITPIIGATAENIIKFLLKTLP
jgi:hydrogenase 3 maturation protease